MKTRVVNSSKNQKNKKVLERTKNIWKTGLLLEIFLLRKIKKLKRKSGNLSITHWDQKILRKKLDKIYFGKFEKCFRPIGGFSEKSENFEKFRIFLENWK